MYIRTSVFVSFETTSIFNNNNEAIQGGGALYVQEGSFLYMKSCSFSNNQVKFPDSVEKTEDGCGGAILLSNSRAIGIHVNFTGNKAYYGGGLFFKLYSKMKSQDMHYRNNIAVLGSAICETTFSTFSCTNCSLYQNQNVAVNNNPNGAAINIYNHSTTNVSGFKCENNTGSFYSCIFATYNSSVFIYNAIFSRNFGSAILLTINSHLLVVNSSFLNNTTPDTGEAIHSENSTLNISHSICYHNKGKLGGAFTLTFSTAVLNYCTFSNNSNKAVVLFLNTSASISNCYFRVIHLQTQEGLFWYTVLVM